MADQLLNQSIEDLAGHLSKPWFDASKINEFRTCPQKYYYHYIKGLVTEETSFHLDYGIGIHKGLEHIYLGTFFEEIEYASEFSKNGKLLRGFAAFLDCFPAAKEAAYKTRLSGLEVLAAYAQKHRNETFDIIGVEQSFCLDMGWFYYIGRMDLIINWESRTMPMDHKTTSRFSPQFEGSFKIDTQITGYIVAVRRLIDEKCNSAAINALRITKNIDNDSFLRKITTRQGWELEQWESELRHTANEIKNMFGGEAAEQYPRDGQRCYDYNSPCPYLNLCLTHPTGRKPIEDANYKVDHWEPL